MKKHKDAPATLELLPLLPAEGMPPAPSSQRPWLFFVLSHVPGVQPVAVGVEGERGPCGGARALARPASGLATAAAAVQRPSAPRARLLTQQTAAACCLCTPHTAAPVHGRSGARHQGVQAARRAAGRAAGAARV
jgi:hypothetical protein